MACSAYRALSRANKRTRRAVGLVVGPWLALWLGVTAASAPAAGPDAGEAFPIAFGGPFTLTDHHGQTRTDRDFRGRHLLVYFGYTWCPDICPTGLQVISGALDLLGDSGASVQPLFVSVDPERDTPAVLKDYLGHFHPRLIGLTGGPDQLTGVMRAYRVHRHKVVPPDTAAEDYLINHGSLTFLIGPDGGFLTLFPHGTAAPAMAAAIRNYLR